MGSGCVCRAGTYVRGFVGKYEGEMSSPRGPCSEADQNHSHRNIGVRAERAGERGLCRWNNAGSMRWRSRTPLVVRQRPCPELPKPPGQGQRAMPLRLSAGVVPE